MNVLVINAGSSSLKYQLLNPTTGELLAKGLCERIGIDGLFTYKPQLPGKEAIKAASVSMPTHNEAIQAVLNALVDEKNGVIGSMKEIDAVGHRVVHGGEKFAKSVVITDEVMQAIEECTPLAPLHNPANITGINACRAVMGDDVPMVAVFDTAFHQTMPGKAYMYAIPYEYYQNDGIRRYGFAYVPLDEALSRVVIDLSGRPGLVFEAPFTAPMIGELDTQLIREFFQGFVNHAQVTLHIDNLRGINAHHQAETIFKAFGRALRMALEPDPRMSGVIPSTKGTL